MVNTERNGNGMAGGGTATPAHDKQLPGSLKKTALRDVQNENVGSIHKQQESLLPGGKSCGDTIKVCGNKRLTPERPFSSQGLPYSAYNGTNENVMNARRRFELELGRGRLQNNIEKISDYSESKNVGQLLQDLTQKQMRDSNLHHGSVATSNNLTAIMAFSSSGPSIPSSFGKHSHSTSVAKISPELPHSVDSKSTSDLLRTERPIIRYSRTSDIAKRIAQEALKLMYQQESGLFDFRRTEVSPLLLIVDRRDDPVTPLLNQWTYQAMVHELIGILDNKVDLRNIGKSSKDHEEVVLSSEQDAFFKANMYENFGDIGMNIKKMVDDFQQVAKSNQNIQTIEDMAKFVDNYPEYRKMHGNVSKHVTLVTEMSRIVEERKLMLVSQTEQELACNGGQGAAFEAVTNLLNNDNVSDIDRLRLVMLYALRYEKESPVQLMQLFNKLASRSPKYKPGLVQFLLKQAGVDRRTGDLYGNRDLLNYALNMARGLKGVENVYTQHQPLLSQTMESIVKGRLRDVDYPYIGNHFQQGRPQDVIIFVVGGTTYEEARSVSLQNATNSGIRFILGGSAVLNSKRFLKDLEEAQRIIRTSSNVI